MTYPLSQAQMGIYATCMNTPIEANYNIDRIFKLDDDIDVERLATALDRVVEAHPCVKARLTTNADGEVVFEDYSGEAFHTPILTTDDIEDVRAQLGADYDLMQDRLFRLEIYKTLKGNYLYVDFHHIVFDGFSFNIFRDDLAKAYDGEPLAAEVVSGFDVALREKAVRQSAQHEEDKAWYAQEYGAASEIDSMPLPDIYDNNETHYGRKCVRLTVDAAAKEQACAKAGVTESILFTSAFTMTLSKYVCEQEVAFNTVYHGRQDKDTHDAFTMMVKTLPVYTNLEKLTTVQELLQHTKKQNRGARQHSSYSYADLATDLGVRNDINFVYQGAFHNFDIILNGRRQQTEEHPTNTHGIKFLCMIIVEDGNYLFRLEYEQNKYSEAFINGFCATYQHILSEMCVKENLADVTVCGNDMLRKLDSFNEGRKTKDKGLKTKDEGQDETVLSLFQKAAKEYPDNIAAVFKEKKYTYRQLDELTDKIGAIIYDKIKDCGKEEPVISILIPRNEYMFILPLAVMKAGCAYQPLDPSYPQERLNFMVKDADAALLLADSELRPIINEYEGEVLLTSELTEDKLKQAPSLHEVAPSLQGGRGESPFILLYTSGSTGVPKGVIIEHRQVIAYIRWYQQNYEMTPSSVTAAYASFGFDANMMDMYPTLTCGATLCIIPEEIRLDLIALRDFMNDNRVTIAFMTTQVAQQFVLNADGCPTLKHLSMGGEKMMSMEPRSDYKLHNLYGPTECTVAVTHYELQKYEPNIPIGKPTATSTIWIVDKALHRLPVGAAGELIVSGQQVARGYLNRPDKTAEAFIEHEGCRWYRTGDIVRYRQDGNIEFVGRKDGQVKIRGFRIELKEVEAVIRDYPGIRDVTVQAFDNPDGGKFIAAYIVSDKEVDTDALNQFILDQKPPYMVPAVTMQIPEIPLNVNQKVDKKALPTPVSKSPLKGDLEGLGEGLPLNALEIELKAIIASVVNTEDFSITDILGYVGLTSISGIKLATLIYKRFGVQVNAKTLAKTGTLQSIENELLAKWMTPEKPEKPLPPFKGGPGEGLPLSFSQQGVYTECMANAGGVQYNLPEILTFGKGVTAERLKDAVMQVLDAHPYMKTHFLSSDKGDIVQQPIEGLEINVPIRKMTLAECEEYRKNFVKPFDLNKGPLFRFEICEVEGKVMLFSDIHHLIADGASINLLHHQLCQALDGAAIQREDYDYYDFVRDQTIDNTAEEYFNQTIGGIEEVSRLLPDIFEQEGKHHQRTVRTVVPSCGIDKVCRQQGITPAAFFLAATATTVSRYLCEEDVTMITISNGRSNLKISDTVGMFVNTLPLALHVGTNDTTSTLLHHASSVFDAAIEHETYPFARVAKQYDFQPQISYACQLGVIDQLQTKEGAVEMESLDLDIVKVPVAIFVNGEMDGQLTIVADYDSSLYTEPMMQHFVDAIANVAHMLTEKENVSELSLTTEKEWAQLDSFNAPLFTDYDHTDTVVSLFRKKVESHPDKMAAIYADKRFTYRQLDEATDVLANVIYNKVSAITGKTNLKEEVVSIIIDRNEWVFLLPLAVLKTGCAYEPLDPSYPSDRLNYMVQDAKASLLIGQEEFLGLVSDYDGEVITTSELEKILETPNSLPSREGWGGSSSPNDLLLMLYTSGSTGKPKGVQIEHHNLVSFAYGIAKADFYTEDCVAAAYASFGFDVCMMDTFCTLLNGGTLVIIPEDMRLELKALSEYMEQEQVTQIFMTTQVGVQFLQNYPNVKHLRYLGMGGEKLPAVNPEGLSYKILNGYGPTENTCGVSLFPIKHWEPNIPLGRPFPTIQGYVLDKSGHRLPPGACGEYCVAGDQPARGYLGLPEKTAEVFVEYKGMRMYHTGDVVRYRENGDVEFVGRKDGMVKIRGFRIELKEVEAAIRPFPGIKDVTVQAYDYDGGGKYLAAFVVADEQINTEELIAFVKSQKPPYMVPAIVMQIGRIPLTVNQKVDKKALPKPQMAAAAFVAPKNKTEEDFCQIFAEVLGQEKVSAASDFFEIGGSSIIALKVVIAAEKRGYTIVYNDVFTYTTAQDMAEHLGAVSEDLEISSSESQESDLVTDASASVYGPNTTEIAPDGYDYRAINALLRGNTLEAFLNGESQAIGDVLLAGATGYLGIHVLKDLIDNYTGKIYCFVRAKGAISAENRIKNLLFYYFENSYDELFQANGAEDARIFIVEGDATDPKSLDGFERTGITVINCAACVKHFSKGNEIEIINVESVRNLILWCIKNDSRLVHVSTGSVMGDSVNNMPPQGFLFKENMLYVGQNVDGNQYVHSKFMAERLIYDAILHHGLNAKVMRVGNLSPRERDGEFQINFKSNNFISTLAAYAALGMMPYEEMDAHVEMSPIDKVARAIMLLATTPRECVCFMPSNQHRPLLGDIVMQLGNIGHPIQMVEASDFQNAVQEALNQPEKVDKMRPLMAYNSSPSTKRIRPLGYDDLNVEYTAQVLYRLGFFWPNTSDEYVNRFLTTISGFNFFE